MGDNANQDVDEEERKEVDEHEATYLTTQPSTLGGGKMRQYQLEGLNWMIRLQENGVSCYGAKYQPPPNGQVMLQCLIVFLSLLYR